MQEDFIKKGVIAEEQEGATVKTATDELVAKVKPKCACSNCKCKQSERTRNATDGK